MTLDELNLRIAAALKLRHENPNDAVTELFTLVQPAAELSRRPALLRTINLVIQSMPSTPSNASLRLEVAKIVAEDEPNNFVNVLNLAEAHAANGEFRDADSRLEEAGQLATTERDQRYLASARERIEALRSP